MTTVKFDIIERTRTPKSRANLRRVILSFLSFYVMQKSAFLYLPVSTPKLIFLTMAIARMKTRCQIERTFRKLISPTKLLSLIYSLPWPYSTDFRVNYGFNLSPVKSFNAVICHNLISETVWFPAGSCLAFSQQLLTWKQLLLTRALIRAAPGKRATE